MSPLSTLEASYYHYSAKSRACIDDMVAKGWLVRQGSLLTHSEGSYFNYYLNQVEFSDGPDLRNKYLHGSQAGGDDERQHFATYITALKLLIALVIKMNDEFWLRDEEGKRAAGSAEGSALVSNSTHDRARESHASAPRLPEAPSGPAWWGNPADFRLWVVQHQSTFAL